MTIITSRRSFIAAFASLLAAPAIVRVENIMPVRNIERFLVPVSLKQFGFDSFNARPAGKEYQWVAKTILGEPSGIVDGMLNSGWFPVPAERYNNKFAISGNTIEVGGCILMEKDATLVQKQREDDAAKARAMYQFGANDFVRKIRAEGFEAQVSIRYGDMRIRA